MLKVINSNNNVLHIALLERLGCLIIYHVKKITTESMILTGSLKLAVQKNRIADTSPYLAGSHSQKVNQNNEERFNGGVNRPTINACSIPLITVDCRINDQSVREP